MERILLFGAGKNLEKYINDIIEFGEVVIVGIVDSDENKWGKQIRGITIQSLDDICDEYDYVIITCYCACEIEDYLVESKGICRDKIKRIKEYVGNHSNGKWLEYHPEKIKRLDQDLKSVHSVAIIVPYGEFNGACLAALYLLMGLQSMGYLVGFVAAGADESFISYVLDRNIDLCIYSNIEFTSYESFTWIHKFHHIIVNTLSAHKCIVNLRYDNILWWIHESDFSYQYEIKLWNQFEENQYNNAKIYCVSQKAIRTFHRYFPTLKADCLEYGLPDFWTNSETKKDGKIVVAIIGRVSYEKGQDLLINAIESMDESLVAKITVWVVGKISKDNYCDELKQESQKLPVKFLGELSHEDIAKLYKKIDILVNASRQDSLPIVVAEAFMNKKIVIASNAIGTMDYIEDGKNAYVFNSDSEDDLRINLENVIANFDKLDQIRNAAREVYLNHFSLESLKTRIKSVL